MEIIMRLRNVPGAREVMVENEYVFTEPEGMCGTWKEVFGNDNPIHIEIGMGKGTFITTLAGMVHDLGKVRLNFYMNEKVEDEILAVDETRYMRMHPSIGYAILADYDYDQTVLDAVLYHHEHYDGTGYPHNLVGKQIPLVGRIMHVCDIFGALISNRDYREGFDVETALDIMIDEVKNFDMKVFLAFQRVAFSDGVMETVIGKGNLDDLFEEEQQ